MPDSPLDRALADAEWFAELAEKQRRRAMLREEVIESELLVDIAEERR